jgi:putative endopeptidase
MTRLTAILAALALLPAACDRGANQSEAPAGPYASAGGIDFTGFDKTVRPEDDFFRYVNGAWLDSTEIPGDRTWWGVTPKLREESEDRQRQIIEELAARTDLDPNSVEAKIGAFYSSLIDQGLVQGKGAEPVRPYLAEIDTIQNKADLLAAFGKANFNGNNVPFGTAIFPDLGDSTRYVSYVFQSGLGLPNRDYYLKEGEKFDQIRAAYPGYIAGLFAKAGFDNGEDRAKRIIAIEHKMAEAQWAPEQNRDVKAIYNLYTIGDLPKVTPKMDWNAYLEAAGLGGQKDLVVGEPSYFTALGALVDSVPLEDWKDYLRFQALNVAAPFLTSEFEDAEFEFNQKLINGLTEKAPRWKTGVRVLNATMGEAVGQVWVARYFPPESKARMEQLVANVLDAFKDGIQTLEWMSDETKAKAEEKRALMAVKIGYPNKWRDYSGMKIVAKDPIANLVNANAFGYQYNLDKLGKPIDREEWGMTPQTVNAYEDPTKNEIVFPAAFLQPPMFNPVADDAVNYGAIGAVIGHETGHAFDDQGRKFDGHGNLSDWWTEDDAADYEAAAARLVEQYNGFSPVEGLNINGKLTLGENLGDLTGITIAYAAYQKSLGGKPAPVIDGLTGAQRFFIGYAQGYRAKFRDEFLRRIVLTDPHSPNQFRVIGILRNFTPFYEAFGVQEGDGMYLPPEERVKIW